MDLFIGLAALGAVLWWLTRAPRRVRAETSPSASKTVHASLHPRTVRPNNRPSSLLAIRRRFEAMDLGKVEANELSLAVLGEDGARAFVTAPQATEVQVEMLRVEASSAELVVLICDALALELGPLAVRFEGLELELDGTTPRGLLLRKLESLQANQKRPELLH